MGNDFVKKDIRPSFIQRMPLSLKKYQWYLPLMPSATEYYDLSEFDLVISSASAMAKGVITTPNTLHICYCNRTIFFYMAIIHSYIN